MVLEDVSKYSYYIYGFTNETRINEHGQLEVRLVEGTGFFTRIENRLFFTSAAHTLLNINHKNQDFPSYSYPTTFRFELNKKHSKEKQTFEFNIPKEQLHEDYFASHAESYTVKLKVPPEYEVNSIEDFFTDNIDDFLLAETAVMYGWANQRLSKIVMDVSIYNQDVAVTENKIESNVILKILSGKGQGGNSGSPLFLV